MSEYGRQTGERVLDEIPFGIWVAKAPTGEVLYANQSFQSIMGMAAVKGAGIAAAPAAYGIFDRQGNLYPVEKLPFSRALTSGAPVMVDDLVIHRGDGRRICVRAFANPIRDDQGAVSHVVIAFVDITAEVQVVSERAEIEKRLEVAIHHAPVLLFMMDLAGVVTVADGALRKTLTPVNGEMIGRSLLDDYKDVPVVIDNVRRALAGEIVTYSVDVQNHTLDVWIGPLRDAGGVQTGAIGICTDVTETRRLQMGIMQDDRIRAMGTVAASVAHEINNPLTYVLGGLEETARKLESLSTDVETLVRFGYDAAASAATLRGITRLKEFLNPVLVGTKRIRDVTRELRTFARPDDERLLSIDLGGVVRSVLSLLRKEIEARARLVEDLAPSPPVRANEARLVQVMTNLLMNAWQALPAPDPTRHVIGVRTGSRGGEAFIEIWDSGGGVPAALREKIFEPFFTTKDIGSGTGLGLFVSRNVVNALQGQISVHDVPGGGALFRVVLPAATGEGHPAVPAPSEASAVGRTEQSRRVLIIDDDALVAKALAVRLAGDRFEVRTVLDARQGLEILLADDRLDLVYCDVMMKDFTGIDFHEALRRKAPERLSKVVFMTGGAFTAEARAFLDERVDTHVEKPFDIVADALRRVGLPA
ncbi:MAG TPA: ATP-binding protein [Polyangia bacterium]|nr:ATP-binding protein [Polyangia bacterium]